MPFAEINGTKLFYLEVGQGLPCLVMHGGLGFGHTYLHPWLDPLHDALRLVYYDHRGNGRSGRPPLETLTFEQFAADADALRAHLGCETIGLIGHSFGGFIALQYALRYPRRVSHLILLDTAQPGITPKRSSQTQNEKERATKFLLCSILKTAPPTHSLHRAFPASASCTTTGSIPCLQNECSARRFFRALRPDEADSCYGIIMSPIDCLRLRCLP